MIKISRKRSAKLVGKKESSATVDRKSNSLAASKGRVSDIKGSYQVTESIPALTARTQLGSIMERATKNKDRFLVSKRGEARVVILSLEDYLKNIVKQPKVLTRLQKQAQKAGTDKLTMEEVNKEIAAVRES